MLWLNDPYPGAPGLRFTVQQPVRASAEVRMDIACFVGLTERGPVSTPVAVDSWSAFERFFGRRGGYRQLPDAVHAFFANGGTRVVVIRCVGSDIPTARWQLEGLRTAGDGRVYLDARDPGRWGAELDIATRLRMRPLTVYRDSANELRCSDPALAVGSVLWFDRPGDYRVVAETDGSGGVTVASSVPDPWADPVSRAIPRVFELVVDAEIGVSQAVLDGGAPPLPNLGRAQRPTVPRITESYPGCGLHVAHPRYLWTVLEHESRLVTPVAVPSASGPTPNLYPHPVAGPFVGPWDASLVPANLHDGEATTCQTTFVPGTPDVFELMQQYEEGAFTRDNDVPRELQPIVTVAFPDLVHARIHGIDRPVDRVEELPPSTRFETCVTEVAEPDAAAEALTGSPYLHLERSSSTNDALAHAARESERTRRLAVLDVPPNDDADAIMTRIRHEHDTTGSARVLRHPDGTHELELIDLDTSDGPDLRVWLSDQPVVAGSKGWRVFDDGAWAELGRLKGNKGNQRYAVPAGTDLDKLTSLTIWCKRFSVSFGAARLT